MDGEGEGEGGRVFAREGGCVCLFTAEEEKGEEEEEEEEERKVDGESSGFR